MIAQPGVPLEPLLLTVNSTNAPPFDRYLEKGLNSNLTL
jgi:hypothetical protein